MAYATDTHTISLDDPVPEGIMKVLRESAPWDTDLTQETSDITFVGQEADSFQMKPTCGFDTPVGFSEWLGVAAAKLSRTLVTVFAATQLNLARLSSDPQLTAHFDAGAILKVISSVRSNVVVVSRGLIAPREQVCSSSLLCPSGGYLAWTEMLRESENGTSE